MSHPIELTFEKVLGAYNALWDIGGQIVMRPDVGDHDNWLLEYRHGLRGMLARLLAVDRHYLLLHQYQSAYQSDAEQRNPNEYALECEYHVGIILFGMDSSLECFVFAMNAIGFAKFPNDFCNITDPKSLRQIAPKNIVSGDPNDKRNPRPGYQLYFPRLVNLWKQHEKLLSNIFEYHDVSKHRSQVSVGSHLTENPKQPGSYMSSTTHTLESLALEYQVFIDELLLTALEEIAAAYGFTITQRQLTN